MKPDSSRGATRSISSVAKQFGVHPQTLRMYEREGLLSPSRSSGNTRRYSRSDLARLELILHLTRELGVNLAGVQVIIHMRERMESLQRQIQVFLSTLRQGQLRQRPPISGTALIPVARGPMVHQRRPPRRES